MIECHGARTFCLGVSHGANTFFHLFLPRGIIFLYDNLHLHWPHAPISIA